MARSLIALLLLAAMLWSGAWVWGKGAIRDGLNDQIALMREQGIEASYDVLDIGGFPFGYEGRIVEPRYAMAVPVETGAGLQTITYRWSAPWMAVETWASDAGELTVAIADAQTLTIQPPGGATPLWATIRSEGLRARLSQADGRTRIDSEARVLTVDIAAQSRAAPIVAEFVNIEVTSQGPQLVDDVIPAPEFSLSGRASSLNLMTHSELDEPLALRGNEVVVAVQVRDARVEAELAATRSSMTAMDAVSFRTGALSGRVAGPVIEGLGPQHLSLSLDVREADLDEALWNQLDPAAAFPRRIARISLDAEADAVLPGPLDDPVTWWRAVWQDATVKTLRMEGVGVELDATAQGSVIDGTPEGTATVTLGGLDGFISNAVKAGLMPQQQAMIYRLMLGSMGRKGAEPGQKVFDLAVRDGLAYVNDVPIGTAPSLAQ